MATSETKLRNNAKYLATLDRIVVRVRKDGGSGLTKDGIELAAAAAGQSVQAYILQAIRERMSRESGE